MTQWLGDYKEDETVYFLWSTNDRSGASITRSTDGTVQVYKDNGVAQSVAGVTDTEDFDSLTGIHACTIDLSADAFYAAGADYAVVLAGAVIDGETVNAVLAHFSIENRFDEVDMTKLSGDATAADDLELLVENAKGTDHKILVSTDAQDLSGSLDVNAKTLEDGAITAAKIAADAITAAKIATDAITSDELATSALNEIADAILCRDWTSVAGEASRSVLNALRFLRNKWTVALGTLVVYEEDDSTIAWQGTVTTDATADPVSEVDPA
jgi:hypothetical protein